MGYYSDTILILDKHASDEFIHLVYKTKDHEKLYLVEHADEGGFVREESGLLSPSSTDTGETMFMWKDRKFLGYMDLSDKRDYPQIFFIADFLREIGQEHYKLWSLGEDNEFFEDGAYRPEAYELCKRFEISVQTAGL